jgi:predicted DCC family thiol-disulfide oxidoreductase YuxK
MLPLPIRDLLYGWVARNRLRWFGAREICFVPDPSDADRFIA